MSYQAIYDIAELCARKDIRNVVLCPGSRCAPLTLAFSRNAKLTCKIFSDERSAAFVAMGMAQQKKRPVILVCTSGTAAYNFSPAIAEAFFQHIPLVVFTADRPAEWVGQQDGQTIFQKGLYNQHIKKSFDLPQHYDHSDDQWMINRVINQAINLANAYPAGPVHINVPFREPFYPEPTEVTVFSEHIRTIEEVPSLYDLSAEVRHQLREEWVDFNKILIVSGQSDYSGITTDLVADASAKLSIPVIGEITSNLHAIENLIHHTDSFIGQLPTAIHQQLKPDLLITFGKSILSKNLKNFLRKNKAVAHWHVQPAGDVADALQSMTRIIRATPEHFFTFINTLKPKSEFDKQKQLNYLQLWSAEERKAMRATAEFFSQTSLHEFGVVHELMNLLPDHTNLHLANSMSVRYANFIGLAAQKKGIKVFSNRGTSGIDGSTSTAIGHALLSDQLNILITGDLAFFYDRNAFWHNYPLLNFRVLLLNNHGGAIFKMIDGPGALPEAETYFVTEQKLTAKHLCQEFDFDYLQLNNNRKLKNLLHDFFTIDGRTKILEIESTVETCKNELVNFKKKINEHYEA